MGVWGPAVLDIHPVRARFNSNLTQFGGFTRPAQHRWAPGAVEWSCSTHSNLVSTRCVLGGWVGACVTWFLFHLSPIAIQIKFDVNWGNFGRYKLVLWLPYIIVLCEVPGMLSYACWHWIIPMRCHGCMHLSPWLNSTCIGMRNQIRIRFRCPTFRFTHTYSTLQLSSTNSNVQHTAI